jgi:hypothetical protein
MYSNYFCVKSFCETIDITYKFIIYLDWNGLDKKINFFDEHNLGIIHFSSDMHVKEFFYDILLLLFFFISFNLVAFLIFKSHISLFV